VSHQALSPRLCFLRNQICHEHSVDPGLFRRRREWFRAKLQERIEIAEEDDGYIDVRPNVPCAHERVVHRHAVSQPPVQTRAESLPIRDRIAERHAQLDDVCSRFRELD